MKMIDIHMHVIPGVDDGSRSVKESMEMLRCSAEQGVEAVIATPHNYMMYYKSETEHVRSQYELLLAEAGREELDIKLFFGAEIYCEKGEMEKNIELLRAAIYPTMNGSDYVLAEFYPRAEREEVIFCIEKLIGAGYRPIVAHVERYSFSSLEMVERLRNMGALFQINVYSVKEEQSDIYRNKANDLIRERFVDFVGSDAHRLRHRPPRVRMGMEYLYETYEEKYIDKILFGNAQELLLRNPVH